METARIAVIGEYSHEKKTHVALNQALDYLKEDYNLDYQWIDTNDIDMNCDAVLNGYTGIWSASGTPFHSLNGAIKAIEYARIHDIPHLGTCGGFQHTMIEFARNVLGIAEASHEEYDSNASVLFIHRLTCSLAGKTMLINIQSNSQAYQCYQKSVVEENYYCNFGVNPVFQESLEKSELLISGIDKDNEIRIIEYPKNRFFMATLFVPHSNVIKEKPHPIIRAFVEESLR